MCTALKVSEDQQAEFDHIRKYIQQGDLKARHLIVIFHRFLSGEVIGDSLYHAEDLLGNLRMIF